jgi:hypothetical protein
MGRKSFINEKSGPLQTQLARDEERRLRARNEAAAAPSAPPAIEGKPIAASVVPRPITSARIDAPRPEPAAPLPKQSFEDVEVAPRIKASQAAFNDLETTLRNLHDTSGSKVHYSIATRALWSLLVRAEAQILEEVRRHPLGKLPSTRERVKYADYEERVVNLIAAAFRKLPRSAFRMGQEPGGIEEAGG